MTDISVAELSRQVGSVLQRFEHLATRLDESYVPKALYDQNKQYVEQLISELRRTVDTLATKDKVDQKADKIDLQAAQQKCDVVEQKVRSLENNLQWMVRIVIAFVVLAVLGAVFATSGLVQK